MSKLRLGMIGLDKNQEVIASRVAPNSLMPNGNVVLHSWAPRKGQDSVDEGQSPFRVASSVCSGFSVCRTKSLMADLSEQDVRVCDSWREVVLDHDVDLISVGKGLGEGRLCVISEALKSGKHVMCEAPIGDSQASIDLLRCAQEEGGGVLFAPTTVGSTLSGRYAMRQTAEGALGSLQSMWYAARRSVAARGSGGNVLAELANEGLVFVLDCMSAPVKRVYGLSRRLFPGGTSTHEDDLGDTLELMVRFADDAVATLELSCCIPSRWADPDHTEYECEIIGSAEALRVEPQRYTVGIYSADDMIMRPGSPPNGVRMLSHFLQAIDEFDPLPAFERLSAIRSLLDAAEKSIEAEEPVRLGH